MPRARSRLALVLVTTLAVVALWPSTVPPVEAQRKKVLTIAAKEPDTLDPHSSTIGQSQSIARYTSATTTRSCSSS